MQRAAMQQGILAKERRDIRQAQANQLIVSIPKDLNRPWEPKEQRESLPIYKLKKELMEAICTNQTLVVVMRNWFREKDVR